MGLLRQTASDASWGGMLDRRVHRGGGEMETRVLGTGLEVSALGFGCMGMSQSYGPAGPRDEMIGLIRKAVELGVTFFDTARGLRTAHQRRARRGGSRSRPRPGGDRHQVRDHDRRPRRTGRRQPARGRQAGAEGSLERLRIETIDLFYQHRVDPDVPIEDVAGAVKDLIDEGKVRHFGLSEAGVRRSAGPTPSIRSPPSRASTHCGGGGPRTSCSRRSTNSASGSFRSARWARAS